MRKLRANETTICADECRRFEQGNHYQFHVDEHGELVHSAVWDEGFHEYIDNTFAVKRDAKYVDELREHFFETRRDDGPDPMDLARDKMVDDWDGGAA
jgi:hypothetical protein